MVEHFSVLQQENLENALEMLIRYIFTNDPCDEVHVILEEYKGDRDQ